MIKAHWKYLKYVLKHKWFVFMAGIRTKAPIWRLMIHDWTKFLPCEWFAYVEKFYGTKVNKDEPDDFKYWMARGPVDCAFDHAWNHHQKVNPHHWQYWLLVTDSDEPRYRALQMPDPFVREMVADWTGAGRAITGKIEVSAWYAKNRDKIILHENTRFQVEALLSHCFPMAKP